LADTRFNRSKSWLKPLEYSAVGVPWVGSDTPEYQALAERGGGIAIRNQSKRWIGAVRRLLTDDAYYQEMSQQARSTAAEFTIEAHAELWLEAWQLAWLRDRETSVPTVLT
jgi:glycosyltransferase involved in cell wall biosynthesis